MKSKILSLTIVLMLLVSSFAYVAFAEEETLEEPSVEETETEDAPADPEILNWCRQQVEARYQEIVGIFGDSKLSPPVVENFMHAQQAMVEAGEKGSTQAAAQMYLMAMKHFRNALRKYLHDNPDALQGFKPGNATEPEPDLNATTSEEIEEARIQLIQRFQEQFRERLNLMYDNLENMTGSLSDGDAVKARNTIQKAEDKLLRIHERISRGEYDEAVDDLENATDSMDEGFGGMEDAFAGQTLRTMNKLEAKVQKLVGEYERKRARGEDTGELDGLIEDLRGNINRSRNDVNANRGNGGQRQGRKPDDKGNNGKGNN